MNEKDFNLDQFDLGQFDEVAGEVDHSISDGLDTSTRAQQTTIYSLFSELDLDKTNFGIGKVSALTRVEAASLIDQLLKMKEEKENEEFLEDFNEYYGEIGEDLKFGE